MFVVFCEVHLANPRYAITLNIKVVDLIWTPLSTWLSKKENWRTEPEMKSHMIVPLLHGMAFSFPNGFKIKILYKPIYVYMLRRPFQRMVLWDKTVSVYDRSIRRRFCCTLQFLTAPGKAPPLERPFAARALGG